METKQITPYTITYDYTFEFNGRVLGFRKRQLFDITETPKLLPFVGHWNVNRVQLSFTKAEALTTKKPIIKDISDLQWFEQERLKHVFDLKKH